MFIGHDLDGYEVGLTFQTSTLAISNSQCQPPAYAGDLPDGWNIIDDADCVVASVCDLGFEIWQDTSGLLILSSAAQPPLGRYRLRFSDQVIVDIDSDVREARVRRGVAVPQATHDHFVLDQLFPRLVAHEGGLVLHAAIVQKDDQAILILGETGSGKSTLAADLARSGWQLLGDDAALVSSRGKHPFVRAIYPSLRLLPDSIEALYPEPPATKTVAHYTAKRRVDLPDSAAVQGRSMPLAAIFALAPAPAGSRIALIRLSAAETCMAAITNAFALDPVDSKRAEQRLIDASKLANAVASFRLSYPRDYSRLPDVRLAITEQLRNQLCIEP